MRMPRLPRVCAIGVLSALIVAGCGPSDEEVRAEIADICDEMADSLEALPAEPSFAALPSDAEEAWSAITGASSDIDRLDAGRLRDDVDELVRNMRELQGAYFDMRSQIEKRDYSALSETQKTGEAEIVAVGEAAGRAGVPECEQIGVRADYFSIATAGGEAAAAAIAPTGDYVTDANAACARFSEDTLEVFLRLGLQAELDVEGSTDASAYLQAVEDIGTITSALGSLIRELQAIPPPAGNEAAAAELIAGFEQVLEGFEDLDTGGSTAPIGEGSDRVDAAAAQLGVACSI